MSMCGQRAQPNEGCALLFGQKFQESDPKTKKLRVVYVVERVECIPSSQLSWGSFSIDEKVLFEKSEQAKIRGLKLVGIYHSHPAPPEPSSMDREFMSNIDRYRSINAVWIIQSTLGFKKTRAFFFSQNRLYEVRHEI